MILSENLKIKDSADQRTQEINAVNLDDDLVQDDLAFCPVQLLEHTCFGGHGWKILKWQ